MFYNLLNAGALLFLLTPLIWLLYLVTKKAVIIDVFWAFNIMLLSFVYAYLGDTTIQRKLLVVSVVCIWAVRLSIYLLLRIFASGEDKRYSYISEGWKNKSPGFLIHFYLQSALVILVSIPLIYILNGVKYFTIFDFVFAASTLFFISGEAKCDSVLKKHKKNNPDKICQEGLWGKSRHPNYFFEICIWTSIAIWGWLSSSHGYFGIISPMTLFIIMNYFTGPLTDKLSEKKHGKKFLDYQTDTNLIFPKFKSASTKA